MFGYLAGFCVYTFAMIGIILVGFIVAKKCMYGHGSANRKDKFLEIENSLVIEPKKTIYVLKAGNEKFLIASDMERTSFLTKLDSSNVTFHDSGMKISSTDNLAIKSTNIKKSSELDSYISQSVYSHKKDNNDMSKLQSNVLNRLLERL